MKTTLLRLAAALTLLTLAFAAARADDLPTVLQDLGKIVARLQALYPPPAPATTPPPSTPTPGTGTPAGAPSASGPAPSSMPAPPASFTVLPTHPRFFSSASELAGLQAKASTPEGKAIVAAALACAKGPADSSGDRLLCAAFCYRFGLALTPPLTMADVTSLGTQAVADLLAIASPRQGVQGAIGWGGAPWAIAYDWLYPLLTDAQKTTLLALATQTLTNRSTADGSVWRGYNQLSGDIPLALALATYGEISPAAPVTSATTSTPVPAPADYVSDVLASNLFAPKPPFWNLAWIDQAFHDGGNREGFNCYWNDCYTNFGTRALWETATAGDKTLALNYQAAAPYWHLFQSTPDVANWFLHTTTFAGGGLSGRELLAILQASTSFSDANGKQLARWLLDRAGGYSALNRTAGEALLFGLLIGDPRVKGVDPGTLGIPLSFTMARPGEFFARSDWTPQARAVWFANHTTGSRVTPAGELALYSRGACLVGNAAHRIAHSYAPRWLSCGVCFVAADGTPANAAINVGSVPDYLPRGTFSPSTSLSTPATSSTPATFSIVAETAPNFSAPSPATGSIAHATRTFSVDAAVSTITLTDDVLCDKSLTPHLVFPCPTQPVLNADGTVTITNGAASCTLSFDTPPAALIPIGGPGHYADGLPGTAYDGKPYLLTGTVLDGDFAKLAADAYANPATATSAASLTTLNKQMGLWRLHVCLPTGGGKLVTTIQVK